MEALRGVKVLVVVESATSRSVIGKTLVDWGMRAELAADGETALAVLRGAAAAGSRFRLVLAERGSPWIHGAAIAREIERNPSLAESMILMVSPHDRMTDPGRCADVGAVCLDKPILRSNLLNAVFEALNLPARVGLDVGEGFQPLPGPPVRALRILLAEDSPAGQKFVDRLVTHRGHQVQVAENGEIALEMVQEHTFDIVLMDVQMPGMDGYAATRAIRALPNPTKASLPILALTAHALLGESERCLAAGMDAYLSKPVDGHRLIQLIEEMTGIADPAPDDTSPGDRVSIRALAVPPAVDAGLSREEAATAPPTEEDPAPAAFDLEQARKICLGNTGIFRDLVEYFFEEREPLLDLMRRSLQEDDPPG